LRRTRGIVRVALAVVVLCGLARAESRVAELRLRFHSASDAVSRAKLMPQLGEAEFQDIREDVAANRTQDALAALKEYRDEVQLCEKGLDAKKVDAEKHPSGFKQLQISLQESLRRLGEISAGLTADDQASFAPVRSDLDEMNRHLVQELFPSGKEKKEK
jgi:hypothetical protein